MVYTNRRETPDTLPLSGLFESAPEDGRVQHMELAVQILRDDGSGGGIDQYVRFCQISDEMRGRHGARLFRKPCVSVSAKTYWRHFC